jgi:hypothetical protein
VDSVWYTLIMDRFKRGIVASKPVIIFGAVILALCLYYFYVADIKNSGSNHFSVVGYVAYVSPAGYNFLILSSSTAAVSGTLPSMDGFPSVGDPNYQYIGDAGYKGTLPNVGDKVTIGGDINNNVDMNPPYTFSATATSINVLIDAQFNATIQGLMQTIQ